MTKKNFKMKENYFISLKLQENKKDIAPQYSSHQTKIHFPKNPGSLRTFDFSPYYGNQCDSIVLECKKAIEELLQQAIQSNEQTLTVYSIVCYCRGFKEFIHFCHFIASSSGEELYVRGINKELITQFISFLAEKRTAKVTQRNIYNFTKSLLMHLVNKGLLTNNIFPKNPYPHSKRTTKGQKPLCKLEIKNITRALSNEIKRIRACDDLLSSYDLSICVLSIALRTGLNPTPILELSTECIEPHPLKKDRRLLVSHKRRGKNTHIQAIRYSEKLSLCKTIRMDVDNVIHMIKQRNHTIRKQSHFPNQLFIYQCTGANKGAVTLLTNNTLHKCIKLFVTQNQLTNPDKKPLVLNVMRLRKTFENRMWELSGQDPFVTASLAGHSVKVSNDYYLEAPPEAQNNWRLMGELRNQELLKKNHDEKQDTENTPIARCKNTTYGDYAPKNGNPCINFMACFRCSSFVVTEDDLYRLFSFYWLLIKERNVIGAKSWNRYYAHIIRIIDTQITPHFNHQKVEQERKNAYVAPHLFWRTNDQLQLEIEE